MMVAAEGGTLAPKLRFPAFQETWKSSQMSEVYTFRGNNSLSRDKLNYTSGSFKNIHYGDIHTKFMQHFHADIEFVPYINNGESHSTIRSDNYCMAGDMVFADASEDMADIGKAIEIIDAGSIPLVSGLHTILARPKKDYFALGFCAYLFSSEGIRKQIQRESQGIKVLGLSSTRLGNVILHYPQALDEQQKIADCLASIDELITLESQKLDTLKRHKKGLMQQLFPAEGETAPRLRFPEFRGAKKWQRMRLEEISTFHKGKGIAKADIAPNGKNLCIRYGELYTTYGEVIDKIISKTNLQSKDLFLSCRNDVLVPSSGETRQDIAKASCVMVDDVALGGDLNIIRSTENGIFLSYLLNGSCSKEIARIAQGDTVVHLYASQLKLLVVAIPDLAEQQKIADCLGSLDDVIAMQARKVDALKTHKKGLMQQLFPRMDEVGA